MTEAGGAFRAALEEYLAARREADTATPMTPRHVDAEERAARASAALHQAAALHAGQVREAARGHAPAALAAEHERLLASQASDPVVTRAADEAVVTARLAAEYERLRDDPGADRAAVNAAARELAAARQAYRVAAGLPLASGLATAAGTG